MTLAAPAGSFAFDSPHDAVSAMHDRLHTVAQETVALPRATGRVLAAPIVTDRPSPACDVSAMDGYAVRLTDLDQPTVPVTGEAEIGHPPPDMPRGAALRIFTGGPVPPGADAVIPREMVTEQSDAIELPAGLEVRPGQHIRRCGENGAAGQTVVHAGTEIDPAAAAALSAFGIARPQVRRAVRVAAVVTGGEVHGASAKVEPWQLRDSNGPALTALFGGLPWVDWLGVRHAPDDPRRLREVIADAIRCADAVLVTGGVSMGDHDHVPGVLAEMNCELIYHKLPVRPGKPALGAVGPQGQAVFGLPGNPVAVLTMARVLAEPALRHLAGMRHPVPRPQPVRLQHDDGRRLSLWWYRPIRFVAPGEVELVNTMGSGDIISAAGADGFVEVPPDLPAGSPVNHWNWS